MARISTAWLNPTGRLGAKNLNEQVIRVLQSRWILVSQRQAQTSLSNSTHWPQVQVALRYMSEPRAASPPVPPPGLCVFKCMHQCQHFADASSNAGRSQTENQSSVCRQAHSLLPHQRILGVEQHLLVGYNRQVSSYRIASELFQP